MTMDDVLRLMDYVETFPPDGDAAELKGQLSAYTHKDLRTACRRFKLHCSRNQSKKSDYLALLLSYWKGDTVPRDPLPAKSDIPGAVTPAKHDTLAKVMSEATEVADYVQNFPPESDIEELRDQLNGCRSRTLRSACVLLELRPHKSLAKPSLLGLLLGYWRDSVMVTPKTNKAADRPTATPQKGKKAESSGATTCTVSKKDKVGKTAQKRVREEVEEEVQEKYVRVESLEDLVQVSDEEKMEQEKVDVLESSLKKAKVVKEWASAMEILSRVDGSADSIASIQALIDGVVGSAVREL